MRKMKKITSIIVGKTEVTEKKNFIWNMIGSGIFSFVSMALSLCVIQIVGDKAGGIFSIAVTISQMLLYIAFFELRTFLITDVEHKYTFGQYHGAKIIACVAMIAFSFVYVVVKRYSLYKTIVILLMCVYRMIDGYADIYEGEFQLNGRLYLSGKSMTFRSVISALMLIVTLIITRNLIVAIIMAIIGSVLCLVVWDINIACYYEKIVPVFDFEKIKQILFECFPFFLGAFLWVYILSASRIAVDNSMSSKYVAYYQVLFMPISIINLFATFFFRPSLTTLAELYNTKKYKLWNRKIMLLLGMIGAFTTACMLGAFWLGIPVLSLISGCDLEEYRMLLVVLMVGGGVNSATFFMYYILTIMRKAKSILIGYSSAALITLITSNYLVKSIGLVGAAYSFVITVLYLFAFFLLCYGKTMRNN